MTNKPYGTLYIGVSNDLARRVSEHTHKLVKSFTQKYYLDKLVYYDYSEEIYNAIEREKQLKNWCREWKISLIEEENPGWDDLYETLL